MSHEKDSGGSSGTVIQKSLSRQLYNSRWCSSADGITGDCMAHGCQQLRLKAPLCVEKNMLGLPFMPVYHMELFVYSCFILPERVRDEMNVIKVF